MSTKARAAFTRSAQDFFVEQDIGWADGSGCGEHGEWFANSARRLGLVEGEDFERRGKDFAFSLETEIRLLIDQLDGLQDRYHTLRQRGQIDPIDSFEDSGE